MRECLPRTGIPLYSGDVDSVVGSVAGRHKVGLGLVWSNLDWDKDVYCNCKRYRYSTCWMRMWKAIRYVCLRCESRRGERSVWHGIVWK